MRILNKKTRIPAAWYQKDDVLTAARKRIKHLQSIFDHLVVAFSGGKDSLAVLHLMKETLKPGEKVKVFFLDEELIPDTVFDVIDFYEKEDWIDMIRIAVPIRSERYVLGKSFPAVLWDPSREWLRPMPPQSVRLLPVPPLDGEVHSQNEIPRSIPGLFALSGKVCVVNGVRATEGPRRFLAIASKLNECYIVSVEGSKVVQQAKPVYDWEERDVLKYLHDEKAFYCRIYDAQGAIGSNLRVSTPLHVEKMLHAPEQDEVDPEFWDRVTNLFPDARLQERYGRELATKTAAAEYAQSWDSITRWINEHVQDSELYPRAVDMLEKTKRRAIKAPDRFPLHYVLNHFVSGLFAKRDILPKQVKRKR